MIYLYLFGYSIAVLINSEAVVRTFVLSINQTLLGVETGRQALLSRG